MKRIRLFGILVLLAWLLAACSSDSSATDPGTRFVPYPEESQLLALTNAFRAQSQQCGTQTFAAAPPLTWVESVGDTAWYHSVDMGRAATENHVGASTVDRLRARGFDPGAVAEMRKRTARPPRPEDAFNAWKADPALCALLMNRNFTVMGAGMYGHHEAQKTPEAHWTQILTTPKTSAAPRLILNVDQINTAVGAGPAPFTAVLINATDPVNWSLSGPGSISPGGGPAVVYTPPASGAGGTATLSVSAGPLTSSARIVVSGAGSQATLSVSPRSAVAYIAGDPLPLTATLSGSSDPIAWSLTGPGSLSATSGSSVSYIPPANADPGASVAVTASAGGSSATANLTLNEDLLGVSVAPFTSFTMVGGSPISFTGTPAQMGFGLSNGSIPPNPTIKWRLSGPGSLSATTGPTTVYTPPTTAVANTGPVTLCARTGRLQQRCASIWVDNISLPVDPGDTSARVGGPSVTFRLTAITAGLEPSLVRWTLSGPGSLSSPTGLNTVYTPPASGGAGSATLTVSYGNASVGSVSFTITINAASPPPASGFQQEMLTLINQFRSQARTCGTNPLPSAPPLALDSALNTAAQLHSQDMAANNYFSHTGLNGSTFAQRAAAAGYTGFALGENIAAGNATAQATFNQWVNSPPHCANMMNASATQMGIGYAANPSSTYTHYWNFINGRP